MIQDGFNKRRSIMRTITDPDKVIEGHFYKTQNGETVKVISIKKSSPFCRGMMILKDIATGIKKTRNLSEEPLIEDD